MEQVLLNYLRILGIPVSKTYFRKCIGSHSDYPSLLSVSDTLSQLGIPHSVLRIQKENLGELPFPYLLHLEKDKSAFIIVKSEKDLKKNSDKLDNWDGVVLLAEANGDILDEEHRISLVREKTDHIGTILFILSILCLFSLLHLQNAIWTNMFLLVTAGLGALLGYFLIAKDLGMQFQAVEKLCNAGTSTNCDSVLTSQNATIFGRFKLSDAVLIYFSFQLIVMGFFVPIIEDAGDFLWVLFAASMLGIPIVIYSFYLQFQVLKTWCTLCLLVNSILLIQAALLGWLYNVNLIRWDDADFRTFVLSIFLLLVIGSIIILLKNRIEASLRAEKAEQSANRVKLDPSVFARLLFAEEKIDDTQFDLELIIGKTKAPIRVLMAANLRCDSCYESFEQATHLVEKYPDKINFSIRFSIPISHNNGRQSDSEQYLLDYWFKNIHKSKGASIQTAKLIRDWYTLNSPTEFKPGKFQELYPAENQGVDAIIPKLILQHKTWFDEIGIVMTPKFFINGYQLPKNYQIGDLKGMIPELEGELSRIKPRDIKEMAI